MKKITVVTIGTVNHSLVDFAIQRTLESTPDVESVLTFSDRPVSDSATFIPIRQSFNRSDYSDFVLKQLWAFVKTEFVLLIQYDGMAVNRNFWSDQFYNYDYIGSPWPARFNWIAADERVGNGGFSLRSAKLLDALRDTQIQRGLAARNDNEDAVICQRYKKFLEVNYGIKFAPENLANQFGHEWSNPTGQTFGFHGHFNFPLYFDDNTTASLIKDIPLPWYNDQIHFFLQVCEQKSYLNSLLTLNKKMEDFKQ